MYSNKTKLDKFIEKNSGSKNILRNLCNKEIERTNKEIELIRKEFEKTKEKFVEEANELFEHNTLNFERTIPNFKYKLELLKSDDLDYKVIKDSVGLDSLPDFFADYLGNKYDQPEDKTEDERVVFKIFRIKLNKNVLNEPELSKDSSLLLLHGTKGKRVEGILREGFKPSGCGKYGPGIYLTDSFEKAFEYGECFVKDEETPKHMAYVFVNKVVYTNLNESSKKIIKDTKNKLNKCQLSFAKSNSPSLSFQNGMKNKTTIHVQKKAASWKDYNKCEQKLKVFASGEQTEFHCSSNDLFDSGNNRISNGTFQVEYGKEKIAAAHHELVTPKYLIQVERKQTVRDFVKDVLYNKFDVPMFKSEKSTLNLNMCTKILDEDFFTELERELDRNLQGEINFIKSKFDFNIKSLLQQLSFNFNCIFETSTNDSIKYKTKLLSPADEDYKFILRSIDDKCTSENSPICYFFKIIPVDKNEAYLINNVSLYLQGVKANKVLDVLTSGYPTDLESLEKQCKKYCFGEDILQSRSCSCFCSVFLKQELQKGISYCKIDGGLKKLSFVFVAADKDASPHLGSSCLKDSRGCYVRDDSFTIPKEKNISTCFEAENMIPAYLIVFSCD